MYTNCPACNHDIGDTPAVEDSCPHCGVIFSKWLKRKYKSSRPVVHKERDNAGRILPGLKERLLFVDPKTDAYRFYGNALIYLVFFIWGGQFILMDIGTNEIGSSFMHNINLVFHEAGHVIFRLLGDFMMILGGSLFQLLMPLIVMVAFVIKNQDNFGASIGLWWLGQSFMDLAPYINDARALELMLLGGGTGADRPGSHDWENILLDIGLIDYDHSIAAMADGLGALLMLLAFLWGGYILLLQNNYRKVLN